MFQARSDLILGRLVVRALWERIEGQTALTGGTRAHALELLEVAGNSQLSCLYRCGQRLLRLRLEVSPPSR